MPTMGLDPELLLIDGKGKIAPASRWIRRDSSTEDEVVHDNASVEIRPRFATCLQVLLTNTWQAMRTVRSLTGWHSRYLSIAPSGVLNDADRCDPSVSEFGCSPFWLLPNDGDAYKTAPEVEASDVNIRSAGFHVHVGLDGPGYSSEERMLAGVTPLVAMFDAFIGLVDPIMNDIAGLRPEAIARRELGYGRAGEFRLGTIRSNIYDSNMRVRVRDQWRRLEYRTLSPWPMSHPTWVWWAASAVRSVVRLNHQQYNSIIRGLPDRSEITAAINECDPHAALELWIASMRALYKQRPVFRRGNDALHPLNAGRLHAALRSTGAAGIDPRRPSVTMAWASRPTRYFPSKSKKAYAFKEIC